MGRQDTDPYRHQDSVVDAALDWFVRLEANSDALTRLEFERWLEADSKNAKAFEQIEQMAGSAALREASTIDAEKLASLDRSNVASTAHEQRVGRRLGAKAWFSIAAALAVVAVGAVQLPGLMLRWQADYMTATGDFRQISLPDGSVMMLNTASAVAIDFDNGRRGVQLLEGEAFFEVVPDPAHPFVVSAAFSHVRVTGTAFAVRAGSQLDTVTLERGHVEVSRLNDAADAASLDPGEMIEVTSDALSPVTPVDAKSALAWVGGRIVFQNRLLSAAVRDLGRYYPEPIFVLSSKVGDIRISGNYRLDDPEGAIRNLAEAAGAKVSRLPGGVLILR
ncbi:transmembrane sensor [Mesorhizobium robiniae]|uniref:Transmembrane sensor n=1 Tax=Mesorhizobium robiniae TaxID=559315 RepID=A0ABV2GRU3_9HYPH